MSALPTSSLCINSLVNCLTRIDSLRKQNSCTIKQLKEKIKDSFEDLYLKLRQKQEELNEKVDELVDKQHENILMNECELHQLLGNLSTFVLIANQSTTNETLEFIPDNLQNRIKKIENKIEFIERQYELNDLIKIIYESLDNIDRSIIVFKKNEEEKESNKSKKIFVSQEYRDSLKEWLPTEISLQDLPSQTKNECKELNSLKNESFELLHRDSESIDVIDESSINNTRLNLSEWLLHSSIYNESTKVESQPSIASSTISLKSDDDESSDDDGDDGVSRIWNKIKQQPSSYWLTQ